ncbi:MAG: hypothetical protein AAGC47_11330 [Bacteroidota bacterium]
MKHFFLLILLFLSPFLNYSQSPDEIDGFPKWNPFLDEANTLANARPFYYPNPVYSDMISCSQYCNELPAVNGCLKKTLRYQFIDNTTLDLSCDTIGINDKDDDTNEKVDVYYSENIDPSQEANGKPVMVILHPITATRLTAAVARRARLAAQRGYVVIVPDYTSAADPRWGSGSLFDACITREDMAFVFQTSVLDISAAIRKVFDYYSPSGDGLTIDEDNIFLWGFSNGAIAALHMAYADEIETLQGGQTVTNGVICTSADPCTFASDINETSFVGYNTPCDAMSSSYCDFDIRSRIKGVSAMAGYLLDNAMIKASDDIPLLLFHGTCDGVIPFDRPTGKQATFRRTAYREGPSAPVPCQASSNYNYRFHGSASIWERLNDIHGSLSQGPYRGFVKVCGIGHSMGSEYSIAANPNLEMAMWEYESFRFFSNILNEADDIAAGQARTISFDFNLAQGLRSDLSSNVVYDNCGDDNVQQTRAERDCRGCAAVPQWSDVGDQNLMNSKGTSVEYLNYLAKNVCPACTDNASAQAFLKTVRRPEFEITQSDDNRYPAVEGEPTDDPATTEYDETDPSDVYCQIINTSVLTSCDCTARMTSSAAPNGDVLYSENEISRAIILDAVGNPVVDEVQLSRSDNAIREFMNSDHGLSKGMYFIHYETGERRAMIIQ